MRVLIQTVFPITNLLLGKILEVPESDANFNEPSRFGERFSVMNISGTPNTPHVENPQLGHRPQGRFFVAEVTGSILACLTCEAPPHDSG